MIHKCAVTEMCVLLSCSVLEADAEVNKRKHHRPETTLAVGLGFQSHFRICLQNSKRVKIIADFISSLTEMSMLSHHRPRAVTDMNNIQEVDKTFRITGYSLQEKKKADVLNI